MTFRVTLTPSDIFSGLKKFNQAAVSRRLTSFPDPLPEVEKIATAPKRSDSIHSD